MDKQQLEEGIAPQLQFKKRGGLLPAITQEQETGEILMLGYINEEALQETLRTGYATFWSTSRNELWTKGKTSGNGLLIQQILLDCDQDAIIFQVRLENGGACHTNNKEGAARKSCFYRKLTNKGNELVFTEL